MKIRSFLLISSLYIAMSLPASATPLILASWNMEWFSSTASNNISHSKRSTKDIAHYKQLFDLISPSILAFQEVNDIAVLKRVVGNDYSIVLSDRALPKNKSRQFSDINQFTGFAIKKSIPFNDPQDIVLSPKTKLRYASYIVINPNGKRPVHLLSVHLKAGCITKYYASKSSCRTLKRQVSVLNKWIKQRINHRQSYLLTGDFNHNLNFSGDWMWGMLTKGLPSKPILSSRQVESKCKSVNGVGKITTYRFVIDHLITSSNLTVKHVGQMTYPETWLGQFKLSDHCPIAATIE